MHLFVINVIVIVAIIAAIWILINSCPKNKAARRGFIIISTINVVIESIYDFTTEPLGQLEHQFIFIIAINVFITRSYLLTY